MVKILVKTDKNAPKKGVFEIKKYFKKAKLDIALENFERNSKPKKRVDFCIVFGNFENNFKELENFVSKNGASNYYFLPEKCSRETFLKLAKFNGIIANKISDINPEIFKKQAEKVVKLKNIKKKDVTKKFLGTKILIVDDVDENINILKEVLNPFCFNIFSLTNPVSASKKVDEEEFDLIFLDVVMPVMDGFSLARKIRNSKMNSKTPIIFVSAANDTEKKIAGYNLGSLAYIEKPIDPKSLCAQVFGILTAKKLMGDIVNEKENFIQMLTHDLKTPIRAQLRALKLLLNGTFGEISSIQREILNEITASNKYMQNMTENVLYNYKEESGKLQFKKEKHDLKSTLEHCLENLKFIILQKNQTVEVRFKRPFSAIGYYDEIEIERVFTNLIANASEHSPENTKIEVEISEIGNFFKVKIKDNGEGIKNREELFLKFSTTAHSYKKVGTGLGLYISRTIVEAHGGKISAKNSRRGGAVITFTIAKNPSKA